jgi:hypothetical protein
MSVGGDGANLIVHGIVTGLCRPILAEPRWELSQINTNEHTSLVAWRRWHESLLVGGTSCPPPSVVTRGEAFMGLATAASSQPPLVADRGSHLLGLSLSGGIVHHQDPLHLVCGLAPQRHLRMNRGSGSLAGELASPWRCL